MNRSAIVPILSLVLAAGCSGGGTFPLSSSSIQRSSYLSQPTTSSGAYRHLYIIKDSIPQEIAEFALPLTPNPSPVVTVPLSPYAFICDPAVDASDLYVSCWAGAKTILAVYSLPLTSGETPSVLDTSFSAYDIAANHGVLYANPYPSRNELEAYSLPYTAGEAPTTAVALPSGEEPDPLGLHAGSQFLYVSMDLGESLESYALPLIPGETPTTVLSVDFEVPVQSADDLYGITFTGSVFGLASYELPLTASSTQTLTTTPLFPPNILAANEHYLFAANNKQRDLRVYKLPLTPGERTFMTVHNLPLTTNAAMVLGP